MEHGDEKPFDGCELDSNGRVIGPAEMLEGKHTIKETMDYHLTFEELEFDDGIVPNVHCWVYNWTSAVKRDLIEALDKFYSVVGEFSAVAETARPQLIKFIETLPFQIVSKDDELHIYTYRCPDEIH